MTCKFGFPMVAAARLDECADMAMDWLAKDQAFHEAHGGRNKSDYWRNQWQLHGAMLARIESRHGHEFTPKPTTTPARCGSTEHVPSCAAEAGFEMERKEPGKRCVEVKTCGTCVDEHAGDDPTGHCRNCGRELKNWTPKEPVRECGTCGNCAPPGSGWEPVVCRTCQRSDGVLLNWTPKGGGE